MELRWRMSAWWTFAGKGARESLAHRANYLFGLVGMLLEVYLLSTIWTAVYADRTSVDGVDLPTMVAYVTLISVQSWLLRQATYPTIPNRVRDGQVAFDLARPVGMFSQILPRQLGMGATLIPFVIVSLPFAVLIGDWRWPDGATAAVAYAISLVLAYVISTIALTILGMVAFWTFETRAIVHVYQSIQRFFAGALVPLWLMPDWLRGLAEVLPFQAIAYTPVSIYLGRLAGGDAWQAIAVQVFWVVALTALASLVWRRALRKVVIQGG